MPKRVFWPLTLVIMGLIIIASKMGYLPEFFWSFWPLILIIVGLGGLLLSDQEDWNVGDSNPKKKVKKTKAAKKPRRRKK